FFSSRRRHTRWPRDWSSDVCSSDLRCYMDGEVSITVRDEGKGFDSNTVEDPTSHENLLFTHGRGIYLMKTLMDEVLFEENGSVRSEERRVGKEWRSRWAW